MVGRAESFDAVDENARMATGAAVVLRLLEAFLAETARKSVLETSERAADMVALLTPRM